MKPIRFKPIVFIDMDGVTTDTCSAIAKLYNMPSDWQPKAYDVWNEIGISEREFYEKMAELPEEWWEELPAIEEGIWLARELLKITKKVFILSSPRSSPASVIGKVRWLRRLLPETKDRHIFIHEKHLIAYIVGPDGFLLDDCGWQVRRWNFWGGNGFLLKTSYSDEYPRLKTVTYQKFYDHIKSGL